MRIALLASYLSRTGGGIFDVVRRTSQLLQDREDADVTVFGFEDEEMRKDLPSWDPVQPKAFSQIGPSAFPVSPKMLHDLLASDAEVLHTHGLWQYPSVTSLRWTRRTGRPHISTPHGMLDEWAVRRSAWKKKIAAALFERANLEEAACIHALCTQEAESIRHFGLHAPICVIPNGVDLPSPDDEERAQHERAKAGPKTVLYLGRLHPKKGLTQLIRGWAAARVATGDGNDWRLCIAGWDQGGYETELKSLVHELRVGESVQFPGPLFGAEKGNAFAAASAFVLPSLSEGVPMAVLEAWAYRLPVLITPECNLPEAYSANAALRIESNPDSIAEILKTLWQMEENERAAIGHNGRLLVEQQFTWTVAVEQMITVYQWTIGKGPAPSVLFAG